jgi:hypothetical protein
MTAWEGARPYDEVHAEQVAGFAAAVAAAVSANGAQQRQAQQWMDAGLPADPTAHKPGPQQGPNL